jgi:hypothetical protein
LHAEQKQVVERTVLATAYPRRSDPALPCDQLTRPRVEVPTEVAETEPALTHQLRNLITPQARGEHQSKVRSHGPDPCFKCTRGLAKGKFSGHQRTRNALAPARQLRNRLVWFSYHSTDVVPVLLGQS